MAQEKKEWVVRINNQSYGPYTGSQLKQLADQGKINPRTAVSKLNSQQWFEAQKLKGLFTPSADNTPPPANPAPPPAAPSPSGPEDLHNLELGDIVMNDPVMPVQQPKVKPRPKDQVKKVVVRSFPVQPMMLNLAAYMLLALACLSLISAVTYMVGILAAESIIRSSSTFDLFSTRGPFFIFRVVSGVADILLWGMVIGIVIVMGLIWQESRDEKITPSNYTIAIIAGPILSFLLSLLACGGMMVWLGFIVVILPIIFVLFYGFMIPQALLLGHWQTYTKRHAIKNVHIISCALTGGALLISMFGIIGGFFAPPFLTTLAVGTGKIAYSGAAAYLGYAFLMFARKLNG